MSQDQKVRAQFGKTAQAYVNSSLHASGRDLDLLMDLLRPLEGQAVLDVATGGGHTALALARQGAVVTAIDLTEPMLVVAEQFVRGQSDAAKLQISFMAAHAEALPFEAGQFDGLTCRIAAHHFENPARFVQEGARVLRNGGQVVVVDNIAPQQPLLAQAMNRIERTRDPSHVQAYSVGQWVEWLEQAGLEPTHLSRWHKTKDFAQWVAISQTPPEVVEEIQAYALGLPEAVQRYLKLEFEGRHLRRLSHEVMVLAAQKL